MKFEWDPPKAVANLKKHKVAFIDAVTVFFDPFAATFPDPDHSLYESREITIGCTLKGKLLVVSHLEIDGKVRLISARPASPFERMEYEEGIDS